MSGISSDEEEPPAGEMEETGSEAQELQSPPPPGSTAPFYQGRGSELLQGEPGCQEAGRVENGQEAEPAEEEREASPAPVDPQKQMLLQV